MTLNNYQKSQLNIRLDDDAKDRISAAVLAGLNEPEPAKKKLFAWKPQFTVALTFAVICMFAILIPNFRKASLMGTSYDDSVSTGAAEAASEETYDLDTEGIAYSSALDTAEAAETAVETDPGYLPYVPFDVQFESVEADGEQMIVTYEGESETVSLTYGYEPFDVSGETVAEDGIEITFADQKAYWHDGEYYYCLEYDESIDRETVIEMILMKTSQ